MAIPEQLQRQIDAAQSIVDSHYGKKPGGSDVTDVTTKPAGEAVAPVKAQVTQTEDENSPTYAQRWRSLNGIVQSEKHRNQSLEAQVQQLQQMVSNLQTGAVTTGANVQHLTDKDTAEYGGDLVDMARRAAREELRDFAGAVGSIKQDLDGVRQVIPAVHRLAQDQQQTAQQRFFSDLAAQVPDYETVNSNSEFHTWLLTADPMTGILRQTYLVDAQRTGDVARVASIFLSWKSLSGTQETPKPRLTPKQELERQQVPGSGKIVEQTDKSGRIWEPSEITKLYEDKTRGKYAGREAEFKALEKDIFDAQREGRIVRRAA